MEKSIIIIGGGLAGLSAGCYGRMNGYRTQIFEMHDKPGGVCTGWKRKGYTIDGAMNWLMGTKPGTAYHHIWRELGAAQRWQIHNHDNYINIESEDGEIITVPCNIDRLEELLIGVGPEDRAEVRRFCKAARNCGRMYMPLDKPKELYTFGDKLGLMKMLPFLNFVRKWGKLSTADYAKRFRNPVLRTLMSMSNEEAMTEMPALSMPFLFSWLHNKESGYVIGGALALVSYIEERYRDLGGELHLKSRVEDIIVENDRAVGIRLLDGSEHRADWVISAADGRTTIFDMLGGRYINDRILGYYRKLRLYPPLVYVGIGLARSFRELMPQALNGFYCRLDEPVVIGGRTQRDMSMLIYSYDPELAEDGKTTVVVQFPADYDYWETLYKDPAGYKAEKAEIAYKVVGMLEQKFPGISSRVEMTDVATPMTWVRYTGNWKGSYEGWFITTKTFMMDMDKTLPGLDNFYMAGQWVNPGGGMPPAVMSGNHTIQLICDRDGRSFTTSEP